MERREERVGGRVGGWVGGWGVSKEATRLESLM